jgi:hypothetical protein
VVAIHAPLKVEAGSFDPLYWVFLDKDTGALLDLTQPGYVVTGAVNERRDGTGATLRVLADGQVWRRTSDGRVYFEPHSADSGAWTFLHGHYQAELSHPSGETYRFIEGPFVVSPELVTP